MKLSIAERMLIALWQDAHGRRSTDEEEMEKIHKEVMEVAEKAVMAKKEREIGDV